MGLSFGFCFGFSFVLGLRRKRNAATLNKKSVDLVEGDNYRIHFWFWLLTPLISSILCLEVRIGHYSFDCLCGQTCHNVANIKKSNCSRRFLHFPIFSVRSLLIMSNFDHIRAVPSSLLDQKSL